jgi:acid phosphatase (class A)
MAKKWQDSDWSADTYSVILYVAAMQSNWIDAVNEIGDPNDANTPREIEVLRSRLPERSTNRQDILDQAQPSGISSVFEKQFQFNEESKRATTLLVRAVIRVGGSVTFFAADKYGRQRPAQRDPSLISPGNKVIESPGHPSYPNGFSVQAHLVALALADAGLDAEQLRYLARRIAVNREIAGVNFPSDSSAGEALAKKIWPMLATLTLFQGTLDLAKAEWKSNSE